MNYLEQFKNINTFIFDVDGVLTNGKLIILESGKLLRQMNTRDGYALRKAVDEGYKVAIITGGRSEGVVKRLQGLGVTDIYIGAHDKVATFHAFTEKYKINPATTLYMGDDMPDYEVMHLVGMRTCPADAANEIRELSEYVSPIKGGEGCVRDVVEKVLTLQDKWHNHLKTPLPWNR